MGNETTLRKIPKFHLISWYGNFVERHSFPKLFGSCAFPQNFHTEKLGEITVFYGVQISTSFIDTK